MDLVSGSSHLRCDIADELAAMEKEAEMSTPEMNSFERSITRRLRRIERILRRIQSHRRVHDIPPTEPYCVDAAGIAFITECEGCELDPYYDQAGYLTVGVGHLLDGPDDPYNRTITQAECDMLLEGDLIETEECMEECVQFQ